MEQSIFFLEHENRFKVAEIIKEAYPAFFKKTIEDADEICGHIFNLLGSGKVDLDSKLNWHRDFKSGKIWPIKYSKKIKIISDKEKSDIKIPWELSRFQHLAILGEAYWFSGDEKYTKEFVSQIEEWIEKNPVRMGINWKCAMEVAIRAINWIVAYGFFADSVVMTERFKSEFLKTLFLHGKFIRGNLEYALKRGNHYLSDIVGLVWLGLFFKGNKEADKWLKFGLRQLVKETEYQVYKDGVDFEASTSYHRLVLELLTYTGIVCKNNDIDLPKEFWVKLEKMFNFVLHYLTPSGLNPQIGDNDNGRLLIFKDMNILDHSYLLTIAAIMFKDNKYKSIKFSFDEGALFIFGIEGKNIYDSLQYAEEGIKSNSYDNAGFYIIRDNEDYMFLSCGPVGQNGKGGHGHNDKLSFVLWVNGKEILVDPGTYAYTAEPLARNLFRGTRYHNTVVLDKKEQNEFHKRSLFRLKEKSKARCLKFEENQDFITFIGEHYGYRPLIHKRKISYDKKKRVWLIKDNFLGKGLHSLEWNYHLPEKITELKMTGNQITLDGSLIIQFPSNPEIIDGWVSPCYGIKRPAKIIRIAIQTKLNPEEIYTTIIKNIA